MAQEEQPPTNADGSPSVRGMSLKDCTECIRKGLQHPTVRFLREKMEKAGCTVWPSLFSGVLNCTDSGCLGFYTSGKGITVCCNQMQVQDEINQVMIHELIHAYDDCRAKNLDLKICAHHACSEIRAYHLSGDCHYKRELLRHFMHVRAKYLSRDCHYKYVLLCSFIKMRGHDQNECIKRSAFNSLKNNPYCQGEIGKDAIEDVWDICYNDTMPFDRAPSSNPSDPD